MSIRIGNEFNPLARLTAGNTRYTQNTGRANNIQNTGSALGAFGDILSASMATMGMGNGALYNNLSGLYSGLRYNVFDASSISPALWGRNDFPIEAFFGNGIDSSVLNWMPRGTEPAADSMQVLNRLNPTLGMKAIVVSPELESRMNANTRLTNDVMDKISGFLKNSDALAQGKEKSDTLILDKDGNISHYRTFVKGSGLMTAQGDAKKPGNIHVSYRARR